MQIPRPHIRPSHIFTEISVAVVPLRAYELERNRRRAGERAHLPIRPVGGRFDLRLRVIQQRHARAQRIGHIETPHSVALLGDYLAVDGGVPDCRHIRSFLCFLLLYNVGRIR